MYKNSTINPQKMYYIRQYMHQFEDMGDGLLRRYETGRTSFITEMTQKIDDITATGTKYAPEHRVHSTVYVGEMRGGWHGRAAALTDGRAALEMNSRSLVDGAIGTAASVAIDAGLAGRDIYKEVKKADDVTKQQVKKDKENAKKYGEKKQKQVARASAKAKSKTPQKQVTAAKMKTNAVNANKYQKQMEDIINRLNKANGKVKTMDAAKTAATLYQKYGDNAYALLQEAVQSPGSYQKLGDGKLKTSRDVIQHLCQMPNTKQNQQVVQSIIQNRAKSK